MFTLETYKIVHLVGLAMLMIAIGGMLFGERRANGKLPRVPGILHGVAIVVMLIGGFGMMARQQIVWPWPGWIYAKVALWLFFGTLPVLIRKRSMPGSVTMILVLVLVGLGAWIALTWRTW